MSRTQRVALAVASAALLTACGALHDTPITDSRANENTSAIKKVDVYSGVSQQADAQARSAARKEAERKAAQEANEAKERVNRKAKADPVGTRNDLTPVPNISGIPAWVIAINWAQTKLGHRYVWGGESDAEGGFDCSGLMQAAYAQAGVKLPRVAADQYRATKVHPRRSELRPGDLVFYGSRSNIHHVGLYVGRDEQGNQMMLHAPNSRSRIRFDRIDYMRDYFGATRVSP